MDWRVGDKDMFGGWIIIYGLVGSDWIIWDIRIWMRILGFVNGIMMNVIGWDNGMEFGWGFGLGIGDDKALVWIIWIG